MYHRICMAWLFMIIDNNFHAMIVVIIYEILVLMDNIFMYILCSWTQVCALELIWQICQLGISTTTKFNILCDIYRASPNHISNGELMMTNQVYFVMSCHYVCMCLSPVCLLTPVDQFPCALRNIWQLVSNVLGRVMIDRGGRTVSSLQQELNTFVLENHES